MSELIGFLESFGNTSVHQSWGHSSVLLKLPSCCVVVVCMLVMYSVFSR